MPIKKSVSLWRCFSVHILYARERKHLNTPIAICGAMFAICLVQKNVAKQRMHEATVKVNQICENLRRRINDEHFALIDDTIEKSKEKNSQKRRKTLSINLKN